MPGTYSKICLHVVFSTKERTGWIDSAWADELYAYIGGIVRSERGVLLAAGGVADHVHLLIGWRPDGLFSELMREIKSRSSRWVSERGPEIRGFAWQEGYAAFSVSPSKLDEVRGYIVRQEEHHHRSGFKEELLALLRAHDIKFDERYVF